MIGSILSEVSPGRRVEIDGGLSVLRRLPVRRRRTIGPWCFVDDYGPVEVGSGAMMRVGPHPHTGLATVTYLLEGGVIHRDGLGTTARIGAGELALMTAGSGIVHAEHAEEHAGRLRGLQLWIALSEEERRCQPSFVHQQDLPIFAVGAFTIRVVLGGIAGLNSPTRWPSPIVAAELAAPAAGEVELALDPGCEYGWWLLDGRAHLNGVLLEPDALVYRPAGAASITVSTNGPARLWLIGGAPFAEPILMWWNFVARRFEEIVEARQRWESGGFAPVLGSPDPPISAPALPLGRLRARS